MRHRSRIVPFLLVALLLGGCGGILDELDNANELAGKPTGLRPPEPKGAKPGAVTKSTKAPSGAATAPSAKPEEEGMTVASLYEQAKGLVGLAPETEGGRLPPDPNDPMVLCRLSGSTGYMLKSGCINRKGSVIASKGVPK